MSELQPDEVFTVHELARAAGVPAERAEAWAAEGRLRLIPGTTYMAAGEAVRAGRRLREATRFERVAPAELFAEPAIWVGTRPSAPAFASSVVHVALLTIAVLLTSLDVGGEVTEDRVHEPARLVFIAAPGPGGGGGGGGLRNPQPAPTVERKAPAPRKASSVPAVTLRPSVTTTRRDVEPPKRPTPAAAPVVAPKPPEKEPEPLPSNVLVAPVRASASDARDKPGVIENGRGAAESQGPGSGGGAGTGTGTGSGEGAGSGIGDGSGGGMGGGPYRPGSGIEPPRLLREVKADYTDEARRRNLQGEVLLEIVVRADGSVGDVRVLQGLGAGLDQRAVQAVRQWRFDPARRKGAPVDVLVEVAVEFMLR